MIPLKYSAFEYKFPGSFASVEDSYTYVKLPYVNKGGKKVLLVLDYVPKEDLHSGRLLSGQTGDLLNNLLAIVKDVYLKDDYPDFSWLACSFNAFRTVGKPKNFQDQAQDVFADRVRKLILKYQPDTVVTFGPGPIRAFIPDSLTLSAGKIMHWYGVPIDTKIELGSRTHNCTIVPSISLNSIVTGDASGASLIGYVARNIANAIQGSIRYKVPVKQLDDHKPVLIDTVSKFDKMLDMLREQEHIAVDTETKNLKRVTNTLLTIQFAKCHKFGYFVPIYHKDTPFVAKELHHIVDRLKDYFEGDNQNEYHIYANANFDLNVLRAELKARFLANNVWDIFAGQYAEDESLKFLQTVTGDYYYSLGNLSTQFGYNGYLTASFGKADRKNISTHDLDDNLIRYGTLDVVVPFAIHTLQRKRAVDEGHTTYNTLVSRQLSDTLHSFSKMESTGSMVDVKYLFHLKTPQSPIEAVIKKMDLSLMNTAAVKKANKLLLKSEGVPEKVGGWATTSTSVFSFRKDDHKRVLFFDVLGLEPVTFGKSINGKPGRGKLDKVFQTTYAEVPEVKMYTELGKAKKLKTAYVNNFLKLLSTDEDFRSDHRVRPTYNYLIVVTGRTSAKDPNLQQVPARSELGKNIKRLFIARAGTLYIKVDYRVHEVRGWGLIAKDQDLAGVFAAAKALRDEYRLHPTPELAKRLKLEADVHIINAAYFFTVLIEKVDKVLRNAVKGVIFGLIYQMSLKSLALTLNKPLDFTKKLVKDFTKRFPRGMKWIEKCKIFARENLYYENPNGFRRHLWGYALPLSCPTGKRIHAEMDRRAVNSPIQGMCAQFMSIGTRQLDIMANEIRVKEDRDVGIEICNSVHDSLENLSPYATLLENLHLVEQALTTRVRTEMYDRYGFQFVVDLEIDFEIGSTLSNCSSWDFSLIELERLVYESIKFQRDELGHKVDVDAAMREVFIDGWTHAPKWIKKQAKNTGFKLNPDRYNVNTVESKTTA
jgi:DNA polymerase I-like protein with 3'-5' exonuclease and polymerase domains